MSYIDYKNIVIEKLKEYFGVLMLDKLQEYATTPIFEKSLMADYLFDVTNDKLTTFRQIQSSVDSTAFALWTMY